jgi:hypothetical protein
MSLLTTVKFQSNIENIYKREIKFKSTQIGLKILIQNQSILNVIVPHFSAINVARRVN